MTNLATRDKFISSIMAGKAWFPHYCCHSNYTTTKSVFK